MLWAALAYSLGIVAGTYLARPISWWVAAGLAFIAAALYFVHKRTWLATSLALAVFFLAGPLHIQLRGASAILDPSLDPFAYGPEVQLTAHVTREGRLREASTNEVSQTVDLQSEEIVTENGTRIPISAGVRLGLYDVRATESTFSAEAAPTMRIFRYGERICVPVKLKLPRNFRNPGAFDYQSYLAAHGIAGIASAKAEDIHLLPGFSGNRLELWRTRIHSSIVAKVHALWPPPQAALIDAMVIGEEAFIDRDTRVDFQRSGTYHVLVVSGMNVTILAFVVFWTLRRAGLPDIPATLFTILFCVAYAFLTEVGAPVWRATLMCAIFLGTRLLYRDRCMVNALGAAALGLLVFDPRQLFTASFQMTFLCVLIVAAIGLPLVERTSRFYRRALAYWDADDYGATLPPRVAQFRIDLRLIAGRLARYVGSPWSLRLVRGGAICGLRIFELLLISAVMQMGLALPMAYYFHRHHHRPSREPRSCAFNAIPDACGRSHNSCGICVTASRQGSRAVHYIRPASHNRHGAWTGKPAPRRPSGSHTISLDDRRSLCGTDRGYESCAPSNGSRDYRTVCAVSDILSPGDSATEAASPRTHP